MKLLLHFLRKKLSVKRIISILSPRSRLVCSSVLSPGFTVQTNCLFSAHLFKAHVDSCLHFCVRCLSKYNCHQTMRADRCVHHVSVKFCLTLFPSCHFLFSDASALDTQVLSYCFYHLTLVISLNVHVILCFMG